MESEDANVDNELKCSNCGNSLTCTPIMIKPNGDSICGRCSPEEDKKHLYVRNNAYEILAKDMIFQCRYHEEGCSFEATIQELEQHEPHCNNHKLKCPVLPKGSCSWIGSRKLLLDHFKSIHPNLIVKHPCDIKPNISKSDEKNMITVFANKIFLIQSKYNNISAKFWYGVRLVDNPKFLTHFEYTFEILSEKGNWYTKNNVLAKEFFQIYCDSQKEIDFNSLLSLLGCFDKLAFQITLIEKENIVKCLDCEKNLLLSESTEQYCEDCSKITVISSTSNLNKCSKGCSYTDTLNNLKKHEAWFCESAKQVCDLCNSNITSRFNHYFEIHKDDVQTNVMTRNDLRLNIKYSAFLIVDDAIFLCLWSCTESYLEFKVISNMTKSDNCQYDCILKMINPRSKIQNKFKLLYSESSVHYDWMANIKPNSTNPFIGIVEKMEYEQTYKVSRSRRNEAFLLTKTNDLYSAYNFELHVIKKTPLK